MRNINLKKQCGVCGIQFSVKPSHFHTRKNCSRKCYKIAVGIKHGSINKKCLDCGDEFVATRSKINKKAGKFCSNKCKYSWASKNRIGGNAPAWKGGKVSIDCAMCGAGIKLYPSAAKDANSHFCSKKCFNSWISESRRGEKSCLWKGGVDPLKHSLRETSLYKNWRQNIFIRDNFKCVECGASGHINAHHIKKFSVLIKEAQEYLPLLAPSEAVRVYSPLWDINNGKTLCVLCHKKNHMEDK